MIMKSVGSNGQISLGKEYAGRLVMIDQIEPGVWSLRLGNFVPDNERWLHTPAAKAKLDRAIAWADANPPKATDIAALEKAVQARAGSRSARARRKSAA